MNQEVNAGRTPYVQPADRRTSEKVFIFVGLSIVLGGIWMLYMGDAPYHPDGELADNHIQIITDS
jgi:hypothetical protein